MALEKTTAPSFNMFYCVLIIEMRKAVEERERKERMQAVSRTKWLTLTDETQRHHNH